MKTTNTLRALAALVAGAGLLNTASAQFSFDIPGLFGNTNLPDVSVSGSVDFVGNTAFVNLFNDSATPATVTQVYLLNPVAPDAQALILPDPNSTNWSLSNNSGNLLSILSLSGTSTDYFGAVLSPINTGGVTQGNSQLFTFTLGAAAFTQPGDYVNYYGSAQPHILIRFQTVGIDGEQSAAGYGWFDDGETPPVPEPRLIAPLAVLGLGGLLLARRRIKARKTAKSA